MSEHTPSATARRTANLLGALACEVSDRLERSLKQHPNETDSAISALNLVAELPGMSNLALSQALRLSHPATARMVAKLQSQGLVDVRDATDRRAVALHITAKGRRQALAAVAERSGVLAGMIGALSAEERRQLTALLEKLLPPLVGEASDGEYICRLCDFAACPGETCPVERKEELLRNAAGTSR